MKPLSSDERYQELALKWLNNTITPEEKEAFAQWYNFAQDKNIILPENYVSDEKELEARIFSEIENAISAESIPSTPRNYKWYYAASAAAIIAVVFSITIHFTSKIKETELVVAKEIVNKPSVQTPQKEKSVISIEKSELLTENDIAMVQRLSWTMLKMVYLQIREETAS